MRPDNPAPLAEAAARRHELTRSRAIQALRELDRTGTPVTFASVASAAGISRSWLYTQADIRDQIQRLRDITAGKADTAIPARQRATDASLRSQLAAALNATASSPRKTAACGGSSPAPSATSAPPGRNQVTIRPAENNRYHAAALSSTTPSSTRTGRSQPWLTRKLKITAVMTVTARRVRASPGSGRCCCAGAVVEVETGIVYPSPSERDHQTQAQRSLSVGAIPISAVAAG